MEETPTTEATPSSPTATAVHTVEVQTFSLDYGSASMLFSEFPLIALLVFSVVFLFIKIIKEKFIDE
jgi:hypothetical protein